MRVGINGLFWNQEFTGSGQYTRHLWRELQEIRTSEDDPADLFLLGDGTVFAGVPSEQQLQFQPPLPIAKAGGKLRKVWWEQLGVPSVANQHKTPGNTFDVVHYPYFAAPLRKPSAPVKIAVTIHDLIPLVLAAYRTGKAAAVYFKLVSAAARRADFIFADSEHSKQDILRYLKIAPSKVSVVYLGVEERYTASPLTGDERFGLLRKYGLNGDERIIFYLGGFDVRKNVPMLIEAFGMALPALKNSEREDGIGRWKLVLGGKRHTSNPRMYPDLTPTVEKALGNETNRVHFTGLIDEADKPLFYRAADLYVFPSTYEGFGLDPLEALASGAPVICSNASSLPEVTGNAARLVSPSLVTGWRDAILELASDSYKRAALSALGPLQASRFTWRKTAERTLELYRMLECINTRGK